MKKCIFILFFLTAFHLSSYASKNNNKPSLTNFFLKNKKSLSISFGSAGFAFGTCLKSGLHWPETFFYTTLSGFVTYGTCKQIEKTFPYLKITNEK